MPNPQQNRRRSRWQQGLHRAWHGLLIGWDWYLFTFGYGIVFILLAMAAMGLQGSVSEPPEAGATPALPLWTAPDSRHWFGTDRGGADLLEPILHASGRSSWLALLATTAGASVGLGVATLAFFVLRERGCLMLQRLGNAAAAIPGILLLFILSAGHGAGFVASWLLLGGICALFVAGRSGRWLLELERRGDVLSARALGYSRRRLLVDHLFTGLWKRAACSAAGLLPGVLLAEACLGFTGIGQRISPATDRLGGLIASGRDAMFDAPWLVIYPGLALAILSVTFATFAWAVRRTLGEPVDDRLF